MNIIDDSFGIYYIQVDSNNYTVFKRTNNKDAKGNSIDVSCGYFSTDYGAIKHIYKLKLLDKKAKVVQLQVYLQAMKRENNRIEELIKNLK